MISGLYTIEALTTNHLNLASLKPMSKDGESFPQAYIHIIYSRESERERTGMSSSFISFQLFSYGLLTSRYLVTSHKHIIISIVRLCSSTYYLVEGRSCLVQNLVEIISFK